MGRLRYLADSVYSEVKESQIWVDDSFRSSTLTINTYFKAGNLPMEDATILEVEIRTQGHGPYYRKEFVLYEEN